MGRDERMVVKFDGSCSSAQQTIVHAVLPVTTQLVKRALIRMEIAAKKQDGAYDSNYLRWFGAPDRRRAHYALRTYRHIFRVLSTKSIEFACDPSKGNYAKVFPGLKRKIHLQQFFWSAPPSGLNSKPGVIVHELAHEVLRAGDFRYSTDRAARLAANSPGLAIRNADNYEYFAETA
jgi:peptidyl-Lys metalloendopeptidase